MIDMLVRRFLGAIPTLLLIIILTFFMMRFTPGGPFDTPHSMPAEIKANLNHAYHLDEPMWQQLLRYLGALSHGDFGPSFTYKDFSVTQLIWQGFPVSLQLGLAAILVALVTGVTLGWGAALVQGTWLDHAVVTFAMLGTVIPNFVFAPLLALIFGVYLAWLPAGGFGDGHQLAYKILPVLCLALPPMSSIARLSRNSLIDTLHQPFLRTARAKGLPPDTILLRHAAPAAILPIVSYLGPATAGIITGSVVVEQTFAIPGIGRYFVHAAINRDYTLVSGVVIFYGVLIVLFNLAVDLLYSVLDPRLRGR